MGGRIDNWLTLNNRHCNIRIENSPLSHGTNSSNNPMLTPKSSPKPESPNIINISSLISTPPSLSYNINRIYKPETAEKVVVNNANIYPKIISRTPQTKRKLELTNNLEHLECPSNADIYPKII